MRIKTCLKDNGGFTLVELIIVIAIISILSVSTILGASILGYGNAKSTTGRIKSLLDNVRIENMTKKEPYYIVINQVDKNYYLTIQTIREGIRVDTVTEKLDLRKGKISFINTDGSTYVISSVPDVNVRDKLEVTFKKDTGGISKNYMNETVKTIVVECNNKSYNIHLVLTTGKVYID